MIPDYLAYRLTGRQVAEVSNASTTQLLNIHHRDYDYDLLDLAGIKASQLPDLVETGTYLGPLLRENFKDYKLPYVEVYAVATHDTASAVVGVPATSKMLLYL